MERAKRMLRDRFEDGGQEQRSGCGDGRKTNPHRRGAKGRIEKQASTGDGSADAHWRNDLLSGKTGKRELRAYVTRSPDAMFWPCMPAGERSKNRRAPWNLFSS